MRYTVSRVTGTWNCISKCLYCWVRSQALAVECLKWREIVKMRKIHRV